MTISETESFLRSHRGHGTLVGDADEPTCNAYLFTVACRSWR
jgi:hypothetical protein